MEQAQTVARRYRAAARHKSRRKRAAQALAAGAAIAAGTQAYASPVRFDNPPPGNPAHFDWATAGAATGLDITQAPGSQPAGGSGPAVFDQYVDGDESFGTVYAPAGGGVQVGGYADWFLWPVPPYTLIPSGVPWGDFGFVSYPDLGSLLPEGQRVYLGLRFDPGDGTHYGWMSVAREGVELEAFAWGYETEAWVPIPGYPEPGTLSLLAFGAAAATARRRRRARSQAELHN